MDDPLADARALLARIEARHASLEDRYDSYAIIEDGQEALRLLPALVHEIAVWRAVRDAVESFKARALHGSAEPISLSNETPMQPAAGLNNAETP